MGGMLIKTTLDSAEGQSARLMLGLPGPGTRLLVLPSVSVADIKTFFSSESIETNNQCRGQTCFIVKA